MTEFVGRTGAQRVYSYPETRQGANTPPGGEFARNFAFGPAGESLNISDAGTEVTWGTVVVPATDPQDIPITPRSTGLIHIEALFSLVNVTTSPVDVQVQLLLDGAGVPIPANEKVTVPASDGEGANGYAVLPFMLDITGALPIGVTAKFSFLLTAETGQSNNVLISQDSSTAEAQEVSVATG